MNIFFVQEISISSGTLKDLDIPIRPPVLPRTSGLHNQKIIVKPVNPSGFRDVPVQLFQRINIYEHIAKQLRRPAWSSILGGVLLGVLLGISKSRSNWREIAISPTIMRRSEGRVDSTISALMDALANVDLPSPRPLT